MAPKHATAKSDDIEQAPPPVEGIIPTAADMELKAAGGRYYLENVWRVEKEYHSADVYDCRTDLPRLVNALFPAVRDLGYELSDESSRFNGVKNCLELAEAWALLCREARTCKKMFIVRRTPENSGPMLMVQRIEHLRGQVTEMAPLSFVAIVRDDQILVTRDRVMEQATTERVLIEFAKQREDCAICQEFIRARQSTVFACGHQIHSDCYEQFIQAGHTLCPSCRSPVEAKRQVIAMEEGGAHARLVAAAKPPPPVVEPLPQSQRPMNMTDEMFDKQMSTMKGLMSKLEVDEERVAEGEDDTTDTANVAGGETANVAGVETVTPGA